LKQLYLERIGPISERGYADCIAHSAIEREMEAALGISACPARHAEDMKGRAGDGFSGTLFADGSGKLAGLRKRGTGMRENSQRYMKHKEAKAQW
jgi:hypothetical protein